MSESKQTRDHEEIKKWAEERGGTPAVVKGTEDDGTGIGLLRIDFPGYDESSLEEISWDEWFDTFDDKNLEFLYQDTLESGETSRFFKLVSSR